MSTAPAEIDRRPANTIAPGTPRLTATADLSVLADVDNRVIVQFRAQQPHRDRARRAAIASISNVTSALEV